VTETATRGRAKIDDVVIDGEGGDDGGLQR